MNRSVHRFTNYTGQFEYTLFLFTWNGRKKREKPALAYPSSQLRLVSNRTWIWKFAKLHAVMDSTISRGFKYIYMYSAYFHQNRNGCSEIRKWNKIFQLHIWSALFKDNVNCQYYICSMVDERDIIVKYWFNNIQWNIDVLNYTNLPPAM